MEYRLQTLDEVAFVRVGEWVRGDVLRDRRPLQTAPQIGSGSGPRPGRNDEPEPEPEPETKKPGSVKRVISVAGRLLCIPWSSHA